MRILVRIRVLLLDIVDEYNSNRLLLLLLLLWVDGGLSGRRAQSACTIIERDFVSCIDGVIDVLVLLFDTCNLSTTARGIILLFYNDIFDKDFFTQYTILMSEGSISIFCTL